MLFAVDEITALSISQCSKMPEYPNGLSGWVDVRVRVTVRVNVRVKVRFSRMWHVNPVCLFLSVFLIPHRGLEGIDIPNIQTRMFLPMRNLSFM